MRALFAVGVMFYQQINGPALFWGLLEKCRAICELRNFIPKSLIGVYGRITGKNEPFGLEKVKTDAVRY